MELTGLKQSTFYKLAKEYAEKIKNSINAIIYSSLCEW